MQPEVLKYLLDIESIIGEIEFLKQRIENSYAQFSKDILLQRAVERDLEIIGEAVRRLLAIRPEIEISAAKKIIGLRNIISHAYDSVEPELIWAIIQRDIPVLAKEVQMLLKGLVKWSRVCFFRYAPPCCMQCTLIAHVKSLNLTSTSQLRS